MMTSDQDLPDIEAILSLLERHFAGEASAADEAVLVRWIAADPERQRLVAALGAQWGPGALPAAHNVDAGWARLARRIRAAPASPPVAAPRALPHEPRRFASGLFAPRHSPLSVAAAACAAAVIAVVAWQALRRPVTPPELQTYATTARQRINLRLGDGTRIVLAPESRLRVPAEFGAERRDVYVEGEAYFDVVHDSTRPFTVFAANASVRDIGTAFAVRGYAEDHAVRVVVREGKVAMSGAGLLGAGDVGHLTAEGRASVRHHANVAALLGWVEGKLVFEEAPLGRVLLDLRRWYGVQATAADPALAGLPFTGSLHDVSPAEAIAVVAATLGLEVRRRGAGVVLERRTNKGVGGER